MKKKIIFILGWISFIVGMIGVVLPILPTTPFILLATYLFANSSDKCEAWIKKSKAYKKYVLEYKRNNGLSMKQKIEILSMVSILLGVSAIIIENTHARLFLFILFCVKLTVLLRYIPTSNRREVVE
ncbi:MAG: YbaN family protein [Bacillaceae bacterium]